jgi:hypothetical protein
VGYEDGPQRSEGLLLMFSWSSHPKHHRNTNTRRILYLNMDTNSEEKTMSVLMNVRVPEELKDDFQMICRDNHTYMTTEIIRFIKRFVKDEILDPTPLQLAKPTFTKPTLKNMWGDSLSKDSDTVSWESSYD